MTNSISHACQRLAAYSEKLANSDNADPGLIPWAQATDAPDCIAFVDFDGVTHPEHCRVDLLFENLPILEAALLPFERCMIVISSSWRVFHPLDEMREYFCRDLQSRVIGRTPVLKPPNRSGPLETEVWGERQLECEAWLLKEQLWLPKARRSQTAWVAIDDREDWFMPRCRNLLLTDSRFGFSPDDGKRLKVMLQERCYG